MKRAMKQDKNKIPVELVPASFTEDIAKVLDHGRKKYGEWDWVHGLPWLRTYGSALRHLYKWAKGEDKDPESGLSHLAHAATNIMFLMVWATMHKKLDNRKKL